MLSETILKGSNILGRSQVSCSRTNWLVKKEYLSGYQNIKKIMNKTFKPIFDTDSLWKVEELLTKNGFADLIVVDRKLIPVGYLSVHKCFQHVLDYGFQNSATTSVKQLMEVGTDSVYETDSMGVVIDYFAKRNDRNFLPVVNSSNRMLGYLCRAKVFSQILKLNQASWHTKVHELTSK